MGFGEYAAHLKFTRNHFWIHPDPSVVAGIFLGGEDVEFTQNDVHCGKITGGSGRGVVLADFLGPAEYAPYVCQVRIANNKLEFEAADNAGIGIFARDTSVTGNTIAAHGSALGIHAEGPLPQSNVIKDNTLSMESGDGILVVIPGTGGSGTVMTGNTINGSGARGIHINAHGAPSAGGAVVADNKIVGFKKPVEVD
jgi:putative cofactor-binding repeat protein